MSLITYGHTFASRLHTESIPELDVKRLMGPDKDVTEHYTHQRGELAKNGSSVSLIF